MSVVLTEADRARLTEEWKSRGAGPMQAGELASLDIARSSGDVLEIADCEAIVADGLGASIDKFVADLRARGVYNQVLEALRRS